uniref:Uncharacterized protein n=1 Tax=Coptotermes formosanus TaxID=36987 RepID=R4UM86_COPFO|nr:hypothetical protein [Coptotermes formosanus]
MGLCVRACERERLKYLVFTSINIDTS